MGSLARQGGEQSHIDEFGIPDDAVLTIIVRTLSGTGTINLMAIVNEDW